MNACSIRLLDDLDDFGGHVAAEANHCDDKKPQKKLDAIFQRIQDLLDKYTDEEPPATIKIEDAKKAKVISDHRCIPWSVLPSFRSA